MTRALLACLLAFFATHAEAKEKIRLLHVSYDATREMFSDVNAGFKESYERAHPDTKVTVLMSHGGSGSQTRAILDGLDADIASLALSSDMDRIAAQGKALSPELQRKWANEGRLFHSAIVFVVRKNNPKHITGWADLTRPEVEVISPNPKSSGGARWNVVAGYMYAKEKYKGDDAKIRQFLKDSFTRARVMDTGARAATTTFVRRHIGDVLVTWESEALLIRDRFKDDELQIITPNPALRASPVMGVLQLNCKKHNTCGAAYDYLDFFVSDKGQALARKHYMRTGDDDLRDISEVGGWDAMDKTLFADGAMWDQLFEERGK